MDRAVRDWIRLESAQHSGLCKLAYFGSYAWGDWGVGSDLDLVAVVRESPEPFHRRARAWDLSGLPVHADLLISTLEEWDRLMAGNTLLARTLEREAIWVYPSEAAATR